MADTPLVQRVYEIKVLGAEEGLKQLALLADEFGRLDKIKRKANEVLKEKVSSGADTKSIKDLSDKISYLESKLKSLQDIIDQTIPKSKKQNEEFKASAAASRQWTDAITETSKKLAELKAQLETVNAAITAYKKNGADADQYKGLVAEQSALKTQIQQTNTQLNNQIKEVLSANGSIASMRAQLNLLNQAFDHLDAETRDGSFGKNLLKDIQTLDSELVKLEASTGRHQRNVGNYGFNGLQNSINQITRELPAFTNSIQTGFLAISNNLPILADQISMTAANIKAMRLQGEKVPSLFSQLTKSIFSWGTALSLGVTALTLYGKNIVEFIGKLFSSKSKLDAFKASQDLLNDSMKESSSSYQGAIKSVNELRTNIDLAKNGLLAKKDVLKQYNEGLGKTMGEAKNLAEAEKKLIDNADAYVKMSMYKAAATLAQGEAAKKAFEAEEKRVKAAEEFLTTGDAFLETGTRNAYSMGGYQLQQQYNKQADKFRQQQADKRKTDAIKDSEDEMTTYEGIAKKFQTEAAKIAKEHGFNFFTDDSGKGAGSKMIDEYNKALFELQKIQKENQINNSQTIMTTEINTYNVRIEAAEKYYERTRELAEMQRDYDLKSIKRGEKSEQQYQADRNVIQARYSQEATKIELDRENKIFELKSQAADKALNLLIKQAQDERDLVTNNPNATELQKLEAQQVFLDKSYSARAMHNKVMLALENEYGRYSVENEKQRTDKIGDIITESSELQVKTHRVALSTLIDKIDADADKKLNEIKSRVANEVKNILENDKLSSSSKAYQIEAAQERAAGDALLSEKEKTLKAYQALEQSGLASKEELAAAKRAVDESELAYLEYKKQQEGGALRVITGWIKDSINSITGYSKSIKATKKQIDDAINVAVANVQQAAATAYNAYFEGKEKQIEKEKEVATQRLQIEEKQVLALAQSEDEKSSIQAQYEYKRQQLEKDAAEKKKKLALQQATIDFAAAAIKTYRDFGWPWGLVAVAGLTAAYFAQRSQIEAQQFAKGGKVKLKRFANGGQVPQLGSGVINTSPNIPSQSNGDNVLATVKTGEVILNKDQQRKLGGAETFRRIGVPGFANGGLASYGKLAYSGSLGSNLQAPINPQSYLVYQNSSVKNIDQLSKNVEMITNAVATLAQQTNQRIDKIQVINSVRDADRVSRNMKKVDSIEAV